MKRSRISLLLLLASFALAGCRDARSFLWRQTHHHGGYVRHEKSVRRMGAAFRKLVPPPLPSKPRHRR
jgi:outer membrane protein assembly factor BamE (lipoprotein component of BamABCDE complex)